MKSLSAPCDKSGFFPFLLAPRGLVSSLRLFAPLVFSSPPLGEITEKESRVRKAFFRSLLGQRRPEASPTLRLTLSTCFLFCSTVASPAARASDGRPVLRQGSAGRDPARMLRARGSG